MVGHPHIFGYPLYVWMSSICLASPCVFGCGHPNIWQCPNVLGASKHTGGYPNIWGHPYILGPQTWMGISKHMAESKHIGGHPKIWGHPNIQWVHPKILGHPNKWGCPNMEGDIQTCRGFPNIQGASKHKRGIQNVGGVQTYGGIKTYSRCIQTYGPSKCMGTYGHPLVSQSMLSLCCVCTGHPNIIKTYKGSSKHMLGVSKQMGCPNIQGAFLHAFLSREAGFATSRYYAQYFAGNTARRT